MRWIKGTTWADRLRYRLLCPIGFHGDRYAEFVYANEGRAWYAVCPICGTCEPI